MSSSLTTIACGLLLLLLVAGVFEPVVGVPIAAGTTDTSSPLPSLASLSSLHIARKKHNDLSEAVEGTPTADVLIPSSSLFTHWSQQQQQQLQRPQQQQQQQQRNSGYGVGSYSDGDYNPLQHHVPGDVSPSFRINVTNTTVNNITYNAVDSTIPAFPRPQLPLVLYVADRANAHLSAMVADNGSIAYFLGRAADGPNATTTYVFSSRAKSNHDPYSSAAIERRVMAVLSTESNATRASLQGRLYFTRGSADEAISPALLSAMGDMSDQYFSLTAYSTAHGIAEMGGGMGMEGERHLPVHQRHLQQQYWRRPTSQNNVSVSVSDCQSFLCPSTVFPSNLTVGWGGSACAPAGAPPLYINASLAPTFVMLNRTCLNHTLLTLATSARGLPGNVGVILVQHPSLPVGQVRDLNYMSRISRKALVVSAEDGKSLYKLIAAAAGGAEKININTTFVPANTSIFWGPAGVVSIDAGGFLRDVPLGAYPNMATLAFAGQYLQYSTNLDLQVSKPALVVPVMHRQVGGTSSLVSMPAYGIAKAFPYLSLDLTLSCPTGRLQSCGAWDRIITVSARCSASIKNISAAPSFEIGRWINGFHRGGRWLTPTPLRALLYGSALGDGNHADSAATTSAAAAAATSAGDPVYCDFTAAAGLDYEDWLLTLSLRFSADRMSTYTPFGPVMSPDTASPVIYPNMNSAFNGPDYNVNRTFLFRGPHGARAVGLAVIISGHGGCEFAKTRHTWLVNGKTVATTDEFGLFTEAGYAIGPCRDMVATRGVVPAQYGTWLLGRNGWCDGMDVPPLTFNITDAVRPGKVNNLTYVGYSFHNSKYDTSGCGGNMPMTTWLYSYDD